METLKEILNKPVEEMMPDEYLYLYDVIQVADQHKKAKIKTFFNVCGGLITLALALTAGELLRGMTKVITVFLTVCGCFGWAHLAKQSSNEPDYAKVGLTKKDVNDLINKNVMALIIEHVADYDAAMYNMFLSCNPDKANDMTAFEEFVFDQCFEQDKEQNNTQDEDNDLNLGL
ncbi:MAG: hypothetical protein IKM43_02535 [Clostridia bacterium]|nr:hypothetical protein [Clostridia bacterium]